MSQIASKNLFDLLGNDPELDPEREPEPPTKVVDKPVARSGKRNAGAEGPAAGTQRPGGAGGRGGRQEGFGRGDQAGQVNNRPERRDDGLRQDRHAKSNRNPEDQREPGQRGRGRGDRGAGGRGGRGFNGRFQRSNRDDRHSHSGIGEHEKQAAHGWGEVKDGDAEWKDEQAGDAIAKAESKDESAGFTPDTSGADPTFSNGAADEATAPTDDAVAAEPEDKTKSYDQYLAEQAEKRLALGDSTLSVRKANEGTKSKFPEGTEVARTEAEDFFAGGPGKAQRQRVQGQKNRLDIDGQYYAPAESGERRGGDRGGRGGRGGGRGRGEFRGDRGAGRGRGRGGDFRGDREPRGEFRGGRGGGNRGAAAGGSGSFNAQDSSAFPALGA